MPWRRLVFLVLSYVSLDLSSPFVPGAFSFNPDECVDGVRQARAEGAARLAQAIASPPGGLTTVRVEAPRRLDRPLAPAQSGGDWLIDVRRAHPPAHEISSLSEDH